MVFLEINPHSFLVCFVVLGVFWGGGGGGQNLTK